MAPPPALKKRAKAQFKCMSWPTPWMAKDGQIRRDPPTLDELVPAPEGKKYLYLIELPTGMKVGVTGHPLKRICQHRVLARNYGIHIDKVWVSEEPVTHYRSLEKEVASTDGFARDEFVKNSFSTFTNPSMQWQDKAYVAGIPGLIYWSNT